LGIQPNKGTYLNSNIISNHKVEIISEDDVHNLIVHAIITTSHLFLSTYNNMSSTNHKTLHLLGKSDLYLTLYYP
jgi:hypothetical protein